MSVELVINLPAFDTGRYEECELVLSGGDARLTVMVSGLEPFVICFARVRFHRFTALPNCTADMIESACFRLVEVVDSPELAAFLDGDRSPRRAYGELHYYRIFLDETGCHEVFAESVSADHT